MGDGTSAATAAVSSLSDGSVTGLVVTLLVVQDVFEEHLAPVADAPTSRPPGRFTGTTCSADHPKDLGG